ncbi:hypothetical protein ACTWLI_14835 [Arthrobacter sp. Hor0625]|uniref:hypothetical protein n=1 Tax=Arthrobacter sp. Hor0625 TaxID=3457358 RepID=UPI00403EF1A6
MPTVGVRVTPKAGLDPEAVKDRLATANWNLIEHIDGGPILALGEFSAGEDGAKALAAATEVGDPVALLDSTEVQDLNEDGKVGLVPLEEITTAFTNVVKTAGEISASSNGKIATASTPRFFGPPNIPAALLARLSTSDRSRVISSYIEGWLRFATNRAEQAAWGPSHEAMLLAHVNTDEARSKAALDLFNEDVRAARERAILLSEVVGMAAAMKDQVKAWTSLAGKVPGLLVLSVLLGALFVGWSLMLVQQGKLTGLELALLAFVFALVSISPATLLLLGRPLKGMDDWTPDKLFGADKDDKKDEAGENDEAVDSIKGAAKPGDGKTDEAKPGEPAGKPAAS